MVNSIAKLGDILYPDTLIFKTQNSLSLANKKDLRISTSQVSALSHSTSTINILGIVLTKPIISDDPFDDFDPQDLGSLPSLFSDAFMTGFDIMKSEDNIIQPIAIYFE